MDNDEAAFKKKYRKELVTILDQCMDGETGTQAVFIVHTPAMRLVSVFAVNANAEDTQGMLLAAAEPYITGPKERTLN